MRNRCEAFEDAIWDRVRFGTDLPADARAHINQCADCARALNEARQLAGVMLQGDCVPPAPDCRSAVMARIAPRQRQPRLTWAYACAGLAIASLAIGAIMSLGPGHEPGRQNVAVMPQSAQPKLIGPAPHRDVHSYANTGERYNPPTRMVKHRVMPKTPENIMVASVVNGPGDVVGNIPVPEIRAEIAPDTTEEKLSAATRPVASTSAALADKYAASTSAAPTAPAPVGMAGTALSAVGDDTDTRARMDDSPRMTGSVNGALATTPNVTYDSTYNADVFTFSVAPNRDTATGKGDVGSVVLAEKRRVATKPAGESGLFWTAGRRAPADDRPVAIVIARWTPPEARPVSYGYDYTDYDTVTGRTTTVSVKRSGNHVEVRLEGKDSPVKGSVDHATIPNV